MLMPLIDLTWLGRAIDGGLLAISALTYYLLPSRLKPLERRLLDTTLQVLPDSLRSTLADQIFSMNVIQHGGGCQKIQFFKVRWCRDRPDLVPPMSITGEKVRLCSIHFRLPKEQRVRHAVISARDARLYEINFDTWANDIIHRSDIEVVRVKPIAPRHLLDRSEPSMRRGT